MARPTSIRTPRLPVAARKAGATKISREGNRFDTSAHFAVSYTPGTVDAVIAALTTHFTPRGVEVSCPNGEGWAVILKVA